MRSGLVFCLFGALAWGQAQVEKSSPAAHQNEQMVASAAARPESAPTITPDAQVITIKGLCDDPKKTNHSDCTTVITRAQFETLVQFVQPNLQPSDRQQFAASYAETLIRAQQAREMGLDSGPRFNALMKLRQELILQYLFAQAQKEEAEHVSDKDIEQYYKDNSRSFEEIEVRELYVPKMQQGFPTDLSPDEVQKRKQASLVTLRKTADELRARAAAGEDIPVLQGEANKVAGYAPSSVLPRIDVQRRRRSNMRSPQEFSVFDLKPGEVSQVFDEPNGYYISKVGAKQLLPLESVKDEITKKLRVDRFKHYQQEAQEYATPALNETYFKTPTPMPEEP